MTERVLYLLDGLVKIGSFKVSNQHREKQVHHDYIAQKDEADKVTSG